jgi:hypothetical protein
VYGQTEEIDRTFPHFLAGVYGTGNSRAGVVGFSKTGAGVIGLSDQQPGVFGTSRSDFGVFGLSSESIGVVGQTKNAASFAGFFNGNVIVVNGAFTASVKNAVVPCPDGTQRVLHCMQSPEYWFEDFGTGELNNGRAIVKLDADFAKVVKLDKYLVFVTPEGDCRGVFVCNKTVTSFEVRELAGGESSVAFSYRIVARRKDIQAHQRFAKIDTRLPAEAPPPPTRKERRAPAPRIEVQDGFVVSREALERKRKGTRTGRG